MKPSSFRLVLAVLAAGLCTSVVAQAESNYAEVSLCGPGTGKKPISKSEYIVLVVEGPTLSFESNPIPNAQLVAFVNELLKKRNVSYIGLYAREGTKYGELIRAVDTLRGTTARNIGVSISELPLGREL